MKAAERQFRMRELFTAQEFVEAESLSRQFRASESTIRRDLIDLEAQGVLRRVHGGAISLLTRDETMDLQRQVVREHEEKQRIGRAAAAEIRDGQTVILGPGSTTQEVARNLVGRPVQVVTNSIAAAQTLWECKTVEVTLTGGYLYPRGGVLMGPFCEQMLDKIAADVLVLGLAGIARTGLSNSNSLTVHAEQKMIAVSKRVIVVADHTKFGREAMARIAPLDVIDLLITDAGLAGEHQEMLRGLGVEFRMV